MKTLYLENKYVQEFSILNEVSLLSKSKEA